LFLSVSVDFRFLLSGFFRSENHPRIYWTERIAQWSLLCRRDHRMQVRNEEAAVSSPALHGRGQLAHCRDRRRWPEKTI
jgi:hypothetical protein